MRLHLDIETYSEVNLKHTGVYPYAEHPSTEVLCMAYAFDDEPVVLWKPQGPWGDVPLYDRLTAHVESGGEVRAHNAQFERVVLNGTAGKKIGFPTLRISQMVCTAAKCRASGLPGALGAAAEALGTTLKDDAGRIDMLALSKPRSGKEKRYTPVNAPHRFQNLYTYCMNDVTVEREIDNLLPDLSEREQRVWELDQTINDRGVAVDLQAIADVRCLIEEYKLQLAQLCRTLTGYNPTQTVALAEWIRAHGYPQLPCMDKDAVHHAVKDDACPDEVKTVLRIYSTHNAKAVSKYEAMLDAVCSDGRLRGMFLYHGAGTGRWASLIVQLQNLFRPVIDDPDRAIELFAWRNLDWIRDEYPGHDPMKVMASCIRGMLVAP